LNGTSYTTKCGKVLDDKDEETFLKDYFQFDIDVSKLYEEWSEKDKNFSKLKTNFSGIRMLRQDPVENLFSFICSQNNNISRISKLVDKLCENYGSVVAEVDGEKYFSFPETSALARPGVEEELRGFGFGYRAKFIHETAKQIINNTEDGGEQWLYKLREMSYEDAHGQLLTLPGVGPKVADCVCLMSLDKPGAIPIDTHMWQIAARDYLPHLRAMKSVTDRAYKEIGDCFRGLYGEYAGWGHSVLFSADLKRFEGLKKGSGETKDVKQKKRKKGSTAKAVVASKKAKRSKSK